MHPNGQHDRLTHSPQPQPRRPPRSGIEIRLKNALIRRLQVPTAIAWIRSHIGVQGNARADETALLHSHLGRVSLHPSTATFEGIIAHTKASRARERQAASFGIRRPDWHRHALSAYTWLRTGKGPQRDWLHHIGKSTDPACPACGASPTSGQHLVFSCPTHLTRRRELLGGRSSWEQLDAPDWRKEGDDPPYCAIESFFDYLYHNI